ncbi:MAG: phosphohistidine phosphatase SixA [Colwellia sp.]|nr:phosphohistidine phosphatase SixA [Colwellia sp.]MCW8865361.1 phosphohistidine phosphatase SixA [Colwellia sp.]MCW9080739.1 phosphohistidine phosphatase SixA [Colwellia sp.]
MQIFIMRHGEASNQCFISNPSDALRPLTTLGEFEAKKMGQWLANTQFNEIEILVSPYLRAQQTCEQVVKSLTEKGLVPTEVKTIDFITPDGDVQQTHDFIDGFIEDSSNEIKAMLLVSHMPFVSYLVAQLTKSQNMPIFETGAIAQISYERHLMQGQLVNLVSPATV